uniref:CD83 antigen-like n=1 Tax=Semicossyphus pulcher TaxID=241346 RepID=UPI0037E8AFA9
MTLDFLNVAVLSFCVGLAVGRTGTEDLPEVVCLTGADVILPCPAKFKPDVGYLAIRWYKDIEHTSSRLSGLLTRDLPNGTTQWYLGLEREVELLGNSTDIFMPNITCTDSGVYTCHLAAPLGEQNRERKVLLTVSDCADASTEILLNDAYILVVAALLLMFALIFFRISYVCLKNFLRERNETTKKLTLLDAPFKPLDKKDLMLIYTLGPKPSKTPAMKHICV